MKSVVTIGVFVLIAWIGYTGANKFVLKGG